jgi:gliding motility-associated-like protein
MAKHCLKIQGYLLAVFISLIFSLNANAQVNNPAVGAGQWKYMNPFQYGFILSDMSFIDNKTGLAVGSSGAIARTTDSGQTWKYIPYKYAAYGNQLTLATFNDVQFVTPSVAYAVGAGGLMVKSTDGGLNWSTVTTPLSPFQNRSINALHFINKDTGYIGGASILSSSSTTAVLPNEIPKVYFTRNGGATWDSLVSPFRPRQGTAANPTPNPVLSAFNSAEIYRIEFVNDSVGYISGSCGQASPQYSAILWKFEKGVLTDYSLHRTKFGISSLTTSHLPSTSQYRGMVAINDSLVLISANQNGIIIRVKTGKNDSTANAVPAIYGAYEKGSYELLAQVNIGFPANTQLLAGTMQQMKKAPGGKIVVSNGSQVAISADNGTTWTASKPPVPYSWWTLYALDVTPNGRIVTGGTGGILYDSASGGSWRSVYKELKQLNSNGNSFDYSSMDWADCNNGIIVGSRGTFIKTNDAGKTWINNTNPVLDAAGLGLGKVMYQSVTGMFFNTFNSIYKSADQGTTNDLLFVEPRANAQLNDFTMVGLDKAWAVGIRPQISNPPAPAPPSPPTERTVIFRSLNANSASPVWDTVKTFPRGTFAPTLRAIRFADQDTGYTCGSRGKVYRTVDGGNTWMDVSPDTLIYSTANTNYTALSVVNDTTIYVGGSSKRLFKSTNAGATWTDISLVLTTNPVTISDFTNISSILMNDVNNGYMVAGGYFLKTTNGWATWTYDMAPLGITSMTLYPKINAPIQNKKLYLTTLQNSFPDFSTTAATILEYGTEALYTTSSTETATNASCTNPTAGTITVTATGGIAPFTYSVNGGAYQPSNVLTGLTTGVKSISVKDGGCQILTKNVTVGFTDNLTLTTNNDTTVCAGAPVQMIATSAATTYAWAPAAGLSNAAISNPVATVNSATAYTVTASLNTCVKTKTVNISIKPSPVVNAGADKIIVSGDIIQLQGSGSNASTIAWTPAGSIVSNGTTFTPTVNPFVTTTYRLTVKDFNNCTSTDDAVVTVIPYCVKVMDAFTPNNDGINDKWLVTNGSACTTQITVNIFNRYGSSVYKNDAYQNNWDGTYSGKPVADGTYYYVIKYRLINGSVLTLNGNVTILR